LRGDTLDLRSDIYSVGATLFTLLTDRAPFEGDNAVQVVANAVNQKPKPLTELRQDVPLGLERIVARCLAKEPDGRYADYRALRNALLPFGSKEPEPALIKVRLSVGWIPVLLVLRARRENGFATVWDLASGTRVVVKPKGIVRPSIEPAAQPEIPVEGADSLGPYQIIKEMVPGEWIVATDPVLRRRVWLLRRNSSELSLARRDVARSGRLRWLQKVEAAEATWDAFEATEGVPFWSLLEGGKRVPWWY